jgi:ABC-type glycerol-3-phosphate transport system permease component
MQSLAANMGPAHKTQLRYQLVFILRRVLLYCLLLLGTVILLFPLYWMVSSSLKPLDEINAFPIIWIPSRLVWENYSNMWNTVPFLTYFKNSCIVAILATTGTTLSSALVGFSFARLRYPGRDALFLIAISTLIVPNWLTLIPQFVLFKNLGWLDTFAPLIVPQLFAQPFAIFLLRQFFLTLPREIEEAAKIDGSSYFRIFCTIALPMVRPAAIAVAVFTFLYNWNDYFYPLVYLSSDSNFTLPLGLTTLQGQYVTHTEMLMAGLVLAVLPCIALFLFCQRWFIQGIVVTGVKG